MSRAALLTFSLLLNVALAGGLWWSRPPVQELPAPVIPPARPSIQGLAPSEPIFASPPVTNHVAIPFHWRELEAEDFQAYAANLRAVGCPERTLRDMLLPRIAEAFKARAQRERLADDYWPTARQTAQRRARSEALEAARRRDQRALIEEIFGRWIRPEQHELMADWTAGTLLDLMLGHLPAATHEPMLALLLDTIEDAQDRYDEDFLLPEEEAALHASVARFTNQLAGMLPPGGVEEFVARMPTIEWLLGDPPFPGLELSGQDLRALMKLRSEFESPLLKDFGPSFLRPEEEAERAAALKAAYRAYLGEARFADYERSEDRRFAEAFEFTEASHLPKSVAVRLFELDRAVSSQAAAVRDDRGLTPRQRDAALAALRQEAERELRATLGTAYDAYQRRRPGWLKQLDPPPAGDPP
jgi:hypothetical protein